MLVATSFWLPETARAIAERVVRSTNNNYQTFLLRRKPQAPEGFLRCLRLARSTKKSYEPFVTAADRPQPSRAPTTYRRKFASVQGSIKRHILMTYPSSAFGDSNEEVETQRNQMPCLLQTVCNALRKACVLQC
jgi:hypothetical protein